MRYSAQSRVRRLAEPLGAGWDNRLHAGLRIARAPAETRSALASALGEAGVESEFFLSLVFTFPPAGRYTHAQGEILLLQLEAAAHRLIRTAAALEVATQGFLSALDRIYPNMRARREGDDVWWPTFPGFTLPGDSLDLRLRRCGFAYRHVVWVHLASSIEAIAEQMSLTLHALATLPPAGVLPAHALHQGLYELSSAWQGDIVQHHVLDVAADSPGLLTAIGRLRTLDSSEDTSLETDLAWANAQLASLGPAFTAARTGVPKQRANARLTELAAREWYGIISALDRLRSNTWLGVGPR
jgi:hypothetical protein